MVISKRLGFSMDELNEMSVQSLIDIAHLISKDPKTTAKRRADQSDIDKFTGYRGDS